MTHTRILLVDNQATFRSGLRMLIHAGMEGAEVFEANSLDEALHHIGAIPDVALLNTSLSGLNGTEGIALLKRKWPSMPVLMLSSQDEPGMKRSVMERGADKCISRAEAAEKIIEAISFVLNKKAAVAAPRPAVCSHARQHSFQHLTPRQCEVLDLLCQGMSNKGIAQHLGLSENTVRIHVQAILFFLQASNRSEAAFAARRLGLVD